MIALVLMELAFWVFDVGPEVHSPTWLEAIVPVGQSREMSPFGFIPHAIIRSHYDSDPRGYFGASLYVDHVHNSVGWRDREHGLSAPPRTLRVLGLGDSFMWGQGVRVEDTMLSRLADLVRVPGYDIETINAGILGTNTVYHLGSLQQRGLQYSPDLVVLLFVPNDVEVAGRHSREGRVELFGFSDHLLSSRAYSSGLRVVDWVHQVIDRRVQTHRYLRDAVTRFSRSGEGWLDCKGALVEMASICRAKGVPLVVGLCPFLIDLDGDYPFRVVHEAVMDACREHRIVCVDLLPYFSNSSGPELWVHPTDQHPNEIAHTMAATSLAPVIHGALVDRVRAAGTQVAGPRS